MSIASITASSRFAGIAGPAHVISDSAELAAYEIGGKNPCVGRAARHQRKKSRKL